jgi:hypothetical protein
LLLVGTLRVLRLKPCRKYIVLARTVVLFVLST